MGVLFDHRSTFDWAGDRPQYHESDAVIYELHVRGFTKNPNSGVDPSRAGTYAGLVEKIPYLKELGVTVVELMPVFQRDPQEGDYWGYMPLNFFAPHAQYASTHRDDEQHLEFKNMVKAFHQAGIGVVLDVVYNHTCEGDYKGPDLQLQGFRQRRLLHAVLRSGKPLCQLFRHRQYLEFRTGPRAQDGN